VSLPALPPAFASTRVEVQRVAVHVLARRRHALTGRFGLRVAPGGIAMPAAGPDHEVLRTAGSWLLRERTGPAATTDALDLRAASLADAATFAEVDLADGTFSVGHDTPPTGAADAPLAVDDASMAALAAWYAFGAAALDAVVAPDVDRLQPSVQQLWPEHFDVGLDVHVGEGRRANLGASPGDGPDGEPYLYVGPWGDERPGEPGYWNAPFGAALGFEALRQQEDPSARAAEFLRQGLARLVSGRTG
jgi:hypothetical protein